MTSPPIRRNLLAVLWVAFAANLGVSVASEAQEIRLLAFGDSITYGYGDTSNPGGGYPPRLQRWLRQQGYDCTVNSFGVGGETTASGLSRIDSVLAEGGDYLLLMEGTNDISQRVGIETIRFNLNEMASRAEALGIVPVHGSVIPRVPTAPVDGGNSATSALALAIREMGAETHRAVVDNFTLFEGLPDLFENYYYYDPEVIDVVGHPNTDGYIEIGGLFLETMLQLLDTPAIYIVPPPGPVFAGTLAAFGVTGNSIEEFASVQWDFGDGGYTVTSPPGDLSTFYLFLEPGTFTVRVRGLTNAGAIAEDAVEVAITGTAPTWQTLTQLLPVAVESNDGRLVSDLSLRNQSGDFGVFEAEFLPEISFDTAAEVRRFVVAPGETLRIEEFLPSAFGLGAARGALRLTAYAFPAGELDPLSATIAVRDAADDDGSDGATVGGLDESNWSAATRQVGEIPGGATLHRNLVLANLDAARGSVRFELTDATGAYVGSGVVDLAANGARLRSLADLFRGLDSHPAPFRVTFAGASIRFSAVALVSDPSSSDVTVLTAAP